MYDPLIVAVPIASDLGRLALAVRHDVFVVEQKVPEALERDAHDATSVHVVAIVDGDVVGTLRLQKLPEHSKFGRVAVRRERRGQGIAKAMMVFAMALARASGETRFALTAQLDKVGLYERLGFSAYGDEIEISGIRHRTMKTY